MFLALQSMLTKLYPIDDGSLDWVEFVGYNNNMPRPAHLREEGVFNINGRAIKFEQNSPFDGARAEWTLDAQVWFSRVGVSKQCERRVQRCDCAVCLNLCYPKYQCPDERCRCEMMDGFLVCLSQVQLQAFQPE